MQKNMDMVLEWDKIGKFLGAVIPNIFETSANFSVIGRLDLKGIEGLILERAPFLCVEKAVILDNQRDRVILSMSVVTREMCDGHFPGRLFIPLIIFAKIIALTGELLVSWVKKDFDIIPLAMRTGDVRAVIGDLIAPPALVLTKARFLSEKRGFSWVEASAWVGNEEVANINRLCYYLMARSSFFAGSTELKI